MTYDHTASVEGGSHPSHTTGMEIM